MKSKDLSKFRTLRIFITIATLSGIDILFFLTMEPWAGGLWMAQLGMLCFLNVGVGFAIYWLMDYASSPTIREPVIYVHPYKEEAVNLALHELNIDKKDAVIYQTYDLDYKCTRVWVVSKKNAAISKEYYCRSNKDNRS
jgi:hypothetical protein